MNIRRAEAKDLPQVMKLLHEVLEVHATLRPDIFKTGTTKYTETQLLEIFMAPDTPVFVAVNDQDEAMGHCFCEVQLYPQTPNTDAYRSVYIDDLCVDEAYRGQGVAKALYNHVVEFAKSLHCFNVTLYVWEGNDRARAFYEQKMGMGVQQTTMETVLKY